MKIMETYTGSDATLEILIMLLGAFILGWVLRWLYDEYLFEYIEDGEVLNQDVVKNNEEGEVISNSIEIEKTKSPINEKVIEIKKDVIVEDKEEDLKLIEGIGPKIEGLLKSAGIKTFESLSNQEPDNVRSILREKGGERYAFHDPATWPDQAKLAFEDRMEELKEYQDFLNGGRA